MEPLQPSRHDLCEILYHNALVLLSSERRRARQIDQAWRILCNHNARIYGGLVEWLANPFFHTAIKILRKFTNNYKIRQALKLLDEAAEESKLRGKN
jgi:hypothetical protein